jgi:hypothetical protein
MYSALLRRGAETCAETEQYVSSIRKSWDDLFCACSADVYRPREVQFEEFQRKSLNNHGCVIFGCC